MVGIKRVICLVGVGEGEIVTRLIFGVAVRVGVKVAGVFVLVLVGAWVAILVTSTVTS